jgi:hypothetical protein
MDFLGWDEIHETMEQIRVVGSKDLGDNKCFMNFKACDREISSMPLGTWVREGIRNWHMSNLWLVVDL